MEKDNGLTLSEVNRIERLEDSSNIVTVLNDVRVKDRLEEKAFKALERRLEPQAKMCKSCKGEGSKMNGDSCSLCQGNGFVIEDADMRAIELVLSPKFPKTQLNVNADIEGMTTDELLKVIEDM
jgi:hypothetical protein